MDSKEGKKKLDPVDNKLKISSRQPPRTCIFLAKIFLKKFGNVELNALGESTKLAVRVAENLHRQGLVTIDKIQSFTNQTEEGRRVKLTVLLTLTPEGTKVVKGEHTIANAFCSDGSFIMYPWVNRLKSDVFAHNNTNYHINPVFKDKNNLCIHGLFAMSKRVVIQQGHNFVKIKPANSDPRFPDLLETFSLKNNHCFQILVELSNTSDKHLPFGIGYHPYIQLGDIPIDSLEIRTNLESNIIVDENLLPIGEQLQLQDIAHILQKQGKIGNLQLDHGFTKAQIGEEGVFVQLYDPASQQGVQVICRQDQTQVAPMGFWQLYTPPDRKRLAVEPQTCCTDAFRVEGSGMRVLAPGEKVSCSFDIEIT